MYKYETHLHTFPVSRCGKASVRDSIEYYKKIGYDGVFVTNHFVDGNLNIDNDVPYEEKIEFYFSDYEEAKKIGKEIGIKVFFGIESSYNGTDFLVYGLDKEWYLEHPEIVDMKRRELLEFFMESGALVIQAHPYREASYIDHIRLFPRSVHGVEVINCWCKDPANQMAKAYAEAYGLIEFAGSDNHFGENQVNLAGMCSDTPITSERDFVERVKRGEMQVFTLVLGEQKYEKET